MRDQLPQLDQGFHALVTDLYDRGLDKDVAVVMWGEFGRAPRISRGDGRDHWPEAGAAVVAGGGFKVGQVIGETDSHAGQSKGRPYTPSNVHLSDGSHYDVLHPQLALVTRTVVAIALGTSPGDLPDRMIYCAPLHITRIEPPNGKKQKLRSQQN